MIRIIMMTGFGFFKESLLACQASQAAASEGTAHLKHPQLGLCGGERCHQGLGSRGQHAQHQLVLQKHAEMHVAPRVNLVKWLRGAN